MNHKVNNVQELYSDAYSLYNMVVLDKADTIINNLDGAVSVLKQNWKGMDAGVQIQDVIEVHNAFVVLRNALAQLAKDSSVVAVNYRQIQIINRANAEELSQIEINTKSLLDAYMDNRDTVDITPEANDGKAKIDVAKDLINEFVSQVKNYYSRIMDNWTIGTGRNSAEEAFVDFLSKSNKYIETLNNVSSSIASALSNYSF